MDRSLKFDYVN